MTNTVSSPDPIQRSARARSTSDVIAKAIMEVAERERGDMGGNRTELNVRPGAPQKATGVVKRYMIRLIEEYGQRAEVEVARSGECCKRKAIPTRFARFGVSKCAPV